MGWDEWREAGVSWTRERVGVYPSGSTLKRRHPWMVEPVPLPCRALRLEGSELQLCLAGRPAKCLCRRGLLAAGWERRKMVRTVHVAVSSTWK